eukprot:scaffold229991_cov23-Tisochrysis_lutea.AAC.1
MLGGTPGRWTAFAAGARLANLNVIATHKQEHTWEIAWRVDCSLSSCMSCILNCSDHSQARAHLLGGHL